MTSLYAECYSEEQTSGDQKETVRRIEVTRKRKHPSLHPLFNLTMQNKTDHISS